MLSSAGVDGRPQDRTGPSESQWSVRGRLRRTRAVLEVRTLERRVDKCLLAGDGALRPAHCPTFPPVTSRKCFGMLSTAQNRRGVFAGIGAILTWRVKIAFGLSRLYEEDNKLCSPGGACLHVIRSNTMYYLLILLFNYKIPSYIRAHSHLLLRS